MKRMKRMVIERDILDCTMCVSCAYAYGNVRVRVCDKTENPDKPGYARPIEDPSIFPSWCTWEDVNA